MSSPRAQLLIDHKELTLTVVISFAFDEREDLPVWRAGCRCGWQSLGEPTALSAANVEWADHMAEVIDAPSVGCSIKGAQQ